MEHVATRRLRDGLSGYLRRVRGGESLIITDRGLPVACLTPLENDGASLQAEGIVEWKRGKPRGSTRPPAVQNGSVSDLVLENRR